MLLMPVWVETVLLLLAVVVVSVCVCGVCMCVHMCVIVHTGVEARG